MGDLGVVTVDGVSMEYVFHERVAAVGSLSVAALDSMNVA